MVLAQSDESLKNRLMSRDLQKYLLGTVAGVLTWASLSMGAAAESSAVAFMYHRFGETGYPSTNTTTEQLDTHITELTSGPYTVLPLSDVVQRLKGGPPLPDRAIALTIDDAYRSIYTVAWPRLKAASLPFTIFVSTAHIDQGSSNHMTWDQLRELKAAGVSIGHHGVSHAHMAAAGRERNQRELDGAFARFEAELGFRPSLFAYPYGEASVQLMKQVEAAGFQAAFGQHSGVMGGARNFFSLPRFALNEKYGSLERFRLAANALPLPVRDITPTDPLLGTANPPAMGFTLGGGVEGAARLSCFTSHEGRARLQRLGPSRIEVRVEKPFPRGRTRLNCTLPGGDGRWHWYGRQFFNP